MRDSVCDKGERGERGKSGPRCAIVVYVRVATVGMNMELRT